MSRIHPAYEIDEAELEQLAPADRVNAQTGAILAHSPVLAQSLGAWAQALQKDSILPSRLIELVRLRIAFFNQCRSCMSIRYDPDATDDALVCSLERPEEADDLTDAEKAALHFAELMATDHLAIDDEVFEGLRRYFSEPEIVELGMHCGQYVGMGRMAASWAMHEHLHERFRVDQDAPYTPWGPGALV